MVYATVPGFISLNFKDFYNFTYYLYMYTGPKRLLFVCFETGMASRTAEVSEGHTYRKPGIFNSQIGQVHIILTTVLASCALSKILLV